MNRDDNDPDYDSILPGGQDKDGKLQRDFANKSIEFMNNVMEGKRATSDANQNALGSIASSLHWIATMLSPLITVLAPKDWPISDKDRKLIRDHLAGCVAFNARLAEANYRSDREVQVRRDAAAQFNITPPADDIKGKIDATQGTDSEAQKEEGR